MDRRFPRDVEWNPPASGKRSGPVMEGTLTSNLAEVMARLSTNSSRRRVFGGNQPGLIGLNVSSKMPFLPVRNSRFSSRPKPASFRDKAHDHYPRQVLDFILHLIRFRQVKSVPSTHCPNHDRIALLKFDLLFH